MSRAPKAGLSLRAAFLLSVSDIFFGAVGVLIIIIVISSKQEEIKIFERYDAVFNCQLEDGAPVIVDQRRPQDALMVEEWLKELPTDKFMVRAAVDAEASDINCFSALRAMVRQHNLGLEQRGDTRAVVAVRLWAPREEAGGE